MKKIILRIIITLVVIIAGIFTYAALQPATYRVTRSTAMKATPEKIFPYINNPKLSNEWMTWKDSDPTAQMTYSGSEEGSGAITSWDSPGQLGTATTEVIESRPLESVKTKIIYTKPFQGTQLAEVSLTPAGNETTVTWSVTGENHLLGRVMCLFMNMDKMVGTEFEKSLANLKAIAEKP
jgi:hypothetical protein